MIEHFFQCPYCWQQISMLIEPSDEITFMLKIVKFVADR